MPLPKNAKNDQYERLERRQRVAVLYVRGESQVAIAAAVGVTQGTISNDLAAIRKQWLASIVQDFGERQAMELAKLDHLEAVAWAAWERSCQPPPAKKDEPPPEPRAGDPRFLEQVRKCVELRARMCGLIGADVDVRQAVNVQQVQPATFDWNEMCRSYKEHAMAEAKALVQPVVPPSLPCGLKEMPTNGQAPQVGQLECRPSRNGHGHGHG